MVLEREGWESKVGEAQRVIRNEQGEMSPELLLFLNEKPILGSDRFSQALCEGDLLELALDSG